MVIPDPRLPMLGLGTTTDSSPSRVMVDVTPSVVSMRMGVCVCGGCDVVKFGGDKYGEHGIRTSEPEMRPEGQSSKKRKSMAR